MGAIVEPVTTNQTTKTVEVNVAAWEGPAVAEGETVWNAPRPLYGRTFEGKFRRGIFYAITGLDDARFCEANLRQDAAQVVFVTNADVEARVLARLAEYGYTCPEDADMTMAELADNYGWDYRP